MTTARPRRGRVRLPTGDWRLETEDWRQVDGDKPPAVRHRITRRLIRARGCFRWSARCDMFGSSRGSEASVFATCLHCHGPLGRNDVIESFPVGRRLAFDARKGRLWVVCPRCARWNLTPLDERWEAIEACERRFRDTRVRVSTDEIGLAELPEGLDLIRIGKPLRPEFAAWRYGAQLQARRRRMHLAATSGAGMAMAGLAV